MGYYDPGRGRERERAFEYHFLCENVKRDGETRGWEGGLDWVKGVRWGWGVGARRESFAVELGRMPIHSSSSITAPIAVTILNLLTKSDAVQSYNTAHPYGEQTAVGGY